MPRASGQDFARKGLPFVIFVVGGAYLLTQFTSGTVAARDHRVKSQSQRGFHLEEEYKAMAQKIFGSDDPSEKDLILKRIPRPDEK